jgi:membrane-bound metal-dependent hydrolase YbcI (DUF457 family)
MIAGHFGFAAIVKGHEPETPLWILMLATVWLDVIFVPLYLAGIETIQPVDGVHAGYGAGVIHADYTHSLVGAIVLSALLGVVAWRLWTKRSGMVVGLVSFSHWLLDLVVHRGDLALLPGNIGDFPRLGFGLWRAPAASAAVELALAAVGAWIYWRAARSATVQAGRGKFTAALSASLILVFGVLVLALDVTGLAG